MAQVRFLTPLPLQTLRRRARAPPLVSNADIALLDVVLKRACREAEILCRFFLVHGTPLYHGARKPRKGFAGPSGLIRGECLRGSASGAFGAKK